MERKYNIITQQVNLATVLKNNGQILQNILNKLNVKNSGLNYHVEMNAAAA